MEEKDILDHEYLQPKEKFTKAQEKALEIIIKKENEINKIQKEIEKILNENTLKNLDLDKFKKDKKIEEFQKLKFPK